jgi:hypothetical protein
MIIVRKNFLQNNKIGGGARGLQPTECEILLTKLQY